MEVLRLTGFSLALVATSVEPSADFSCSSDCSCLDKGVDFISKCLQVRGIWRVNTYLQH